MAASSCSVETVRADGACPCPYKMAGIASGAAKPPTIVFSARVAGDYGIVRPWVLEVIAGHGFLALCPDEPAAAGTRCISVELLRPSVRNQPLSRFREFQGRREQFLQRGLLGRGKTSGPAASACSVPAAEGEQRRVSPQNMGRNALLNSPLTDSLRWIRLMASPNRGATLKTVMRGLAFSSGNGMVSVRNRPSIGASCDSLDRPAHQQAVRGRQEDLPGPGVVHHLGPPRRSSRPC